jgi:hypothetical protein
LQRQTARSSPKKVILASSDFKILYPNEIISRFTIASKPKVAVATNVNFANTNYSFKKSSLPESFSDCRQSPLFQADFCYVEACKPDKKLVQ